MKKIIESKIFLLSENNIKSVPVKICYTDEEVLITLKYEGTEYRGIGTDYLWADALADLQRKLPDGTLLACCMTCRYGNMCPYGNKEDQLFCTKGERITSKEDLIELIDNGDPFFERAVSSLHYCDGFAYQSEDCYTYNDYLFHLLKK